MRIIFLIFLGLAVVFAQAWVEINDVLSFFLQMAGVMIIFVAGALATRLYGVVKPWNFMFSPIKEGHNYAVVGRDDIYGKGHSYAFVRDDKDHSIFAAHFPEPPPKKFTVRKGKIIGTV